MKLKNLAIELTGATEKIKGLSLTTEDMARNYSLMTGLNEVKSKISLAMALGNILPKWYMESVFRVADANAKLAIKYNKISDLSPGSTITNIKKFCAGVFEDKKEIEGYYGNLVKAGEFEFKKLRTNRLYGLVSAGMPLGEAKQLIQENESTAENFEIARRIWYIRYYKNDPSFDYNPISDTVQLNLRRHIIEYTWKPLERDLVEPVKSLCFTAGIPGIVN